MTFQRSITLKVLGPALILLFACKDAVPDPEKAGYKALHAYIFAAFQQELKAYAGLSGEELETKEAELMAKCQRVLDGVSLAFPVEFTDSARQWLEPKGQTATECRLVRGAFSLLFTCHVVATVKKSFDGRKDRITVSCLDAQDVKLPTDMDADIEFDRDAAPGDSIKLPVENVNFCMKANGSKLSVNITAGD